ncbi:MAG: TRAM domain-containing protein [Thermoleophilaceae bacterium]
MPDAPAAAKRVRPKKGEQVEVTIDSLAHGGAGIGRAEAGFVVFVRGVVPGDRVRARIDKAKRSFAEARLTELIAPSPDRREVEVAHPGAPWQVMPYEMQLAEKQQQVSDALTRLGGSTTRRSSRSSPPSSSGVTATRSSTPLAQRIPKTKPASLPVSRGMPETKPASLPVSVNGAARVADPRLSPSRPLGPDRPRRARHPRLRARGPGA